MLPNNILTVFILDKPNQFLNTVCLNDHFYPKCRSIEKPSVTFNQKLLSVSQISNTPKVIAKIDR